MRNNLAFLCGLLILIFGSCKRWDGDTLLEGKVVDAFSGQPVPNAWIGVYDNGKVSSSTGWAGAGINYKFLGEGRADNKGRFNFQVDGGRAAGPFHLRAGLEQYNYAGYTEDNEVKKGRNNKDLVVKFKQPWPAVIHMQDTGTRTKTVIEIGDFTPNPIVYFYDVQDTIFRTTLVPFQNPYSFDYYLTNYSDGIPKKRTRIDINLPQNTGDSIRINIRF